MTSRNTTDDIDTSRAVPSRSAFCFVLLSRLCFVPSRPSKTHRRSSNNSSFGLDTMEPFSTFADNTRNLQPPRTETSKPQRDCGKSWSTFERERESVNSPKNGIRLKTAHQLDPKLLYHKSPKPQIQTLSVRHSESCKVPHNPKPS